jgi:hypothetical protein
MQDFFDFLEMQVLTDIRHAQVHLKLCDEDA